MHRQTAHLQQTFSIYCSGSGKTAGPALHAELTDAQTDRQTDSPPPMNFQNLLQWQWKTAAGPTLHAELTHAQTDSSPPSMYTQAVFQWQWKTMAGPSTRAGLTPPPEYAAAAKRSSTRETPTAMGAMLPGKQTHMSISVHRSTPTLPQLLCC